LTVGQHYLCHYQRSLCSFRSWVLNLETIRLRWDILSSKKWVPLIWWYVGTSCWYSNCSCQNKLSKWMLLCYRILKQSPHQLFPATWHRHLYQSFNIFITLMITLMSCQLHISLHSSLIWGYRLSTVSHQGLKRLQRGAVINTRASARNSSIHMARECSVRAYIVPTQYKQNHKYCIVWVSWSIKLCHSLINT